MRLVSEDDERVLGGGEKMKKAVLYINQFFGQIGGEEQAGIAPEIHEGQVGPAMQFAKDRMPRSHTPLSAVITIWEPIPRRQ